MGKIKTWLTLITQMGPVASVAKQFEALNRFFVLDVLKSEGLFEFLQKPRTFEEVIDNFHYKDISYAHDLFDILKNDQNKLILYSETEKKYQINPKKKLPELKDLMNMGNFEKIFNASKVPQKFAKNIPSRLKGKSVDFIDELKEPGPSLFEYDGALSHRLYTALRNTAFAFMDKKKLLGKKILDLGCGSGQETVELWIYFEGRNKIIATDPIGGFIDIAKTQFQTMLEETILRMKKERVLPVLTEENTPEFKVARAEDLKFDAESFDLVFLQQILHWTTDPRKSIQEIGRVLKKGGIFFGSQGTLPLNTPYMNLMITSHEKVHGFFSLEDFNKWLAEANFTDVKRVTPAGIFQAYKK